MQDTIIDFALGAAAGGLGLSLCWGLFWLVVGSIGLTRGTCTWRVVANSALVGGLPLVLGAGLFWARGGIQSTGLFTLGLLVMPLVLLVLGLRNAPDGQRAGVHVFAGMRHLMEELLGGHRGCGGCDHEHESGDAGGCG
ncbi:conserved membrane protein of unknown function [Nitrospira japonica]|uniref:Uncharacterized protein n=1 Tax=Nitrospira japonica TaxID=1325564 RepID=A0A1W1I030_9BACT|nr:hypothetical protein [Nitrospira japonica]SLM46332.1 conserved membrane protein of unknown function [Nitrospira japonica]